MDYPDKELQQNYNVDDNNKVSQTNAGALDSLIYPNTDVKKKEISAYGAVEAKKKAILGTDPTSVNTSIERAKEQALLQQQQQDLKVKQALLNTTYLDPKQMSDPTYISRLATAGLLAKNAYKLNQLSQQDTINTINQLDKLQEQYNNEYASNKLLAEYQQGVNENLGVYDYSKPNASTGFWSAVGDTLARLGAGAIQGSGLAMHQAGVNINANLDAISAVLTSDKSYSQAYEEAYKKWDSRREILDTTDAIAEPINKARYKNNFTHVYSDPSVVTNANGLLNGLHNLLGATLETVPTMVEGAMAINPLGAAALGLSFIGEMNKDYQAQEQGKDVKEIFKTNTNYTDPYSYLGALGYVAGGRLSGEGLKHALGLGGNKAMRELASMVKKQKDIEKKLASGKLNATQTDKLTAEKNNLTKSIDDAKAAIKSNNLRANTKREAKEQKRQAYWDDKIANRPIIGRVGKYGTAGVKAASKLIAGTAITAGMEGVSEAIQTVSEQTAKGRKYDIKEVTDAATLGALVGGAIHVGGTIPRGVRNLAKRGLESRVEAVNDANANQAMHYVLGDEISTNIENNIKAMASAVYASEHNGKAYDEATATAEEKASYKEAERAARDTYTQKAFEDIETLSKEDMTEAKFKEMVRKDLEKEIKEANPNMTAEEVNEAVEKQLTSTSAFRINRAIYFSNEFERLSSENGRGISNTIGSHANKIDDIIDSHMKFIAETNVDPNITDEQKDAKLEERLNKESYLSKEILKRVLEAPGFIESRINKKLKSQEGKSKSIDTANGQGTSSININTAKDLTKTYVSLSKALGSKQIASIASKAIIKALTDTKITDNTDSVESIDADIKAINESVDEVKNLQKKLASKKDELNESKGKKKRDLQKEKKLEKEIQELEAEIQAKVKEAETNYEVDITNEQDVMSNNKFLEDIKKAMDIADKLGNPETTPQETTQLVQEYYSMLDNLHELFKASGFASKVSQAGFNNALDYYYARLQELREAFIQVQESSATQEEKNKKIAEISAEATSITEAIQKEQNKLNETVESIVKANENVSENIQKQNTNEETNELDEDTLADTLMNNNSVIGEQKSTKDRIRDRVKNILKRFWFKDKLRTNDTKTDFTMISGYIRGLAFLLSRGNVSKASTLVSGLMNTIYRKASIPSMIHYFAKENNLKLVDNSLGGIVLSRGNVAKAVAFSALELLHRLTYMKENPDTFSDSFITDSDYINPTMAIKLNGALWVDKESIRIGKLLAKRLGITLDDSAPQEAQDKLYQQLGMYVIDALRGSGLIVDWSSDGNKIKASELYVNNPDTQNADAIVKYLQINYGNNMNITGLRGTISIVSKLLKEAYTEMKMETDEDLHLYSRTPQTTPKSNTDRLPNDSKEAINNLNKIEYDVAPGFKQEDSLLNDIFTDPILLYRLKALMGRVDENSAVTTTEEASIKGKNLSVDRSVKALQEFINHNAPTTFIHKAMSVLRIFMSHANGLNPQGDKLHRFLVPPANAVKAMSRAEFDKEIKDENSTLYIAIAQAFGIKVELDPMLKDTKATMDGIRKNVQDILDIVMKDTASFEKFKEQILNAMEKGKTTFKVANVDINMSAIGHFLSVVSDLETIAKLDNESKGGVAFLIEADAKTQGYMLRALTSLMDPAYINLLHSGGIHLVSDESIASKYDDVYVTIGKKFLELVTNANKSNANNPNAKENDKDADSMLNRVPQVLGISFVKLDKNTEPGFVYNIVEQLNAYLMATLEVKSNETSDTSESSTNGTQSLSSATRDFIKDLATPAGYSAGLAKITKVFVEHFLYDRRNLTQTAITYFLNNVDSKDEALANKGRATEALLDSLIKIITSNGGSITYKKQEIKSVQDLQSLFKNKRKGNVIDIYKIFVTTTDNNNNKSSMPLFSILEQIVSDVYKPLLDEAIYNQFPLMKEVGDNKNSGMNNRITLLTSALHNKMKQIADENGGIVSIKQFKEVLNALRKFAPDIQVSPKFDNNDDVSVKFSDTTLRIDYRNESNNFVLSVYNKAGSSKDSTTVLPLGVVEFEEIGARGGVNEIQGKDAISMARTINQASKDETLKGTFTQIYDSLVASYKTIGKLIKLHNTNAADIVYNSNSTFYDMQRDFDTLNAALGMGVITNAYGNDITKSFGTYALLTYRLSRLFYYIDHHNKTLLKNTELSFNNIFLGGIGVNEQSAKIGSNTLTAEQVRSNMLNLESIIKEIIEEETDNSKNNPNYNPRFSPFQGKELRSIKESIERQFNPSSVFPTTQIPVNPKLLLDLYTEIEKKIDQKSEAVEKELKEKGLKISIIGSRKKVEYNHKAYTPLWQSSSISSLVNTHTSRYVSYYPQVIANVFKNTTLESVTASVSALLAEKGIIASPLAQAQVLAIATEMYVTGKLAKDTNTLAKDIANFYEVKSEAYSSALSSKDSKVDSKIKILFGKSNPYRGFNNMLASFKDKSGKYITYDALANAFKEYISTVRDSSSNESLDTYKKELRKGFYRHLLKKGYTTGSSKTNETQSEKLWIYDISADTVFSSDTEAILGDVLNLHTTSEMVTAFLDPKNKYVTKQLDNTAPVITLEYDLATNPDSLLSFINNPYALAESLANIQTKGNIRFNIINSNALDTESRQALITAFYVLLKHDGVRNNENINIIADMNILDNQLAATLLTKAAILAKSERVRVIANPKQDTITDFVSKRLNKLDEKGPISPRNDIAGNVFIPTGEFRKVSKEYMNVLTNTNAIQRGTDVIQDRVSRTTNDIDKVLQDTIQKMNTNNNQEMNTDNNQELLSTDTMKVSKTENGDNLIKLSEEMQEANDSKRKDVQELIKKAEDNKTRPEALETIASDSTVIDQLTDQDVNTLFPNVNELSPVKKEAEASISIIQQVESNNDVKENSKGISKSIDTASSETSTNNDGISITSISTQGPALVSDARKLDEASGRALDNETSSTIAETITDLCKAVGKALNGLKVKVEKTFDTTHKGAFNSTTNEVVLKQTTNSNFVGIFTAEETAAHELGHSIFDIIIDDVNDKHTRILHQLYLQAMESIDPDVIYNNLYAPHLTDSQKRLAAEKIYSYIDSSKAKTKDEVLQALKEFATMATSNSALIRALKDIEYKDPSRKEAKSNNFISKFFKVVMDKARDFWDLNVNKVDTTNLYTAIRSIELQMAKTREDIRVRQERHNSQLYVASRLAVQYLGDKARNLMAGLGEVYIDVFGDPLNMRLPNNPTKLQSALFITQMYIGLMLNGHKYDALAKSSGISLQAFLHRIYGLKYDSSIRSLVRDMQQPTPVQRKLEDLHLKSTYIDAKREFLKYVSRTHLDKEIFGENTEVTAETKNTLGRVILSTDLVSLFDMTVENSNQVIIKDNDMNRVISYLIDDARIDEDISKYKTDIRNIFKDNKGKLSSDAFINYIEQTTNDTAYMMITGNARMGTLSNAKAIVDMSWNKDRLSLINNISKSQLDEIENIVDKIISLKAIKHLDEDTRKQSAKLFSDTMPDSVKKALIYAHNVKAKDYNDLFNDNKYNYVKGYRPDIIDPSIMYKVGRESDRAKMEELGYTPAPGGKEILGITNGILADRVLYINTDIVPVIKHNKGAVRLTDNVTKDITLTEMLTYAFKNDGLDFDGYSSRIQLLMKDSNYKTYSVLNGYLKGQSSNTKEINSGLIPVFNETGKIVNYKFALNDTTKATLLGNQSDFSSAITTTEAYAYDKRETNKLDTKIVELIVDDYNNASEAERESKGVFVEIGPKSPEPVYQNLYRLLPTRVATMLTNKFPQGKIMIREEYLLEYFGFKDLDIRTTKLYKTYLGTNGKKWLRQADAILQAIVRVSKANTVVKSFDVVTYNIVSNMNSCLLVGIDPNTVIKNHIEAVSAFTRYLQQTNEISNLTAKMNSATSEAAKQKIQNQITRIKHALDNTDIAYLINAGLYSTIQDRDGVEEALGERDKVTAWFKKWLKGNTNEEVQKGLDYLYLNKGTDVGDALAKIVQRADFVSRLAMFSALRKQKDPDTGFLYTKEKAKEVVTDMFVNYETPTSPTRKALEDRGLIMFTKYNFRIQRAIFGQLLRHNPLFYGSLVTTEGLLNTNLPDIGESFMFGRDPTGMIYTPWGNLTNAIEPPVMNNFF